MIAYKYKALNLKGNKVKGKLKVEDEKELIYAIRRRKLFLIDYKLSEKEKFIVKINKVNSKEISIFCRQFGQILRSGIDIEKGFEILCNEKINPIMKESLYYIKIDVEKGKNIYNGMNKFPNIYPKFMREMIQIGEESGNLEKVFLQLSEYYIEEYNIEKKIKTALIYPCTVLVSTLIITIFIILKILPSFVESIVGVNGEIPSSMNRIIKFNKFIMCYKFRIFSLITLLLIYILHNKGILKDIREKTLFKLPISGQIYKEIYEINFIKSLSILISSGIPIVSSLEIIKRSIKNIAIREKILKVIFNIREGIGLAQSLKSINLFNDFYISMISIGEETGNLEEMINNAVNIKEFDVRESINKISKIIEPVIIIILAVIITLIIFNILIPIVNSMENSFG